MMNNLTDNPIEYALQSKLGFLFTHEDTFAELIARCVKAVNDVLSSQNEVINEVNEFESTALASVNALVDSMITTWKTDGTLESLINASLQAKYDALKKIGVSITEFGAHAAEEFGYSTFNNHDAIIAAFDYAKQNKIAKVIFPTGTWKTTGLDLKNYSYIDMVGVSSNTFANLFETAKGTVISFLPSTIDYGVLLDDTAHIGDAYNRTHGNTIQNIYFDCNHTIKYGLQISFACIIQNVFVTNAVYDGIVLGSCSYPVTLKNVFSDFNDRHGVYVNGSMTTVYFMQDCEFYGNDGFGLVIEGGANPHFDNLTIQSNGAGGIKINYPNIPTDHYLQNLLFENVYTENCGTIDSSNGMFCDNPALLIDSSYYGIDPSKRATNITFKNCSFNNSATGKSLIIKAGYNINFDGGVNLSKATIDNTSATSWIFYPIGVDSTDMNLINPNRNFWTEIWSGTGVIGTGIDLYVPTWCSRLKFVYMNAGSCEVTCDVDLQEMYIATVKWFDRIAVGVNNSIRFRIERLDSDYHFTITPQNATNGVAFNKILGQF
jgi:hypothetical protein